MTLKQCLSHCISVLEKHSDTPALDSRIIISEVCNVSDTDFLIHGEKEITEEQSEKIKILLDKRISGFSVAYAVGHRWFYRHSFKTPEGVLVPRPDTETLVENAVESALKLIENGKTELRILDLCAGTGCIGISTAAETVRRRPGTRIELHMSDISSVAFDTFTENAKAILTDNGISVYGHLGDLFCPLAGLRFDMILTNPPYIESSVIPTLSVEVRKEPVLALDGGEDGLDVIRRIVALAPMHLNRGGVLMIEGGYNQGPAMRALLENNLFSDVRIIKDLGGNDRVVSGLCNTLNFA